MITNQTIDGVPRELKPCPFCGGSADLKCTAGDYPDWFVQCTECHASVDVFGPGAVHHWNDRKLPAAQPQGEPVAIIERARKIEQLRGAFEQRFKLDIWPVIDWLRNSGLYAEQLAPVAVVLPELDESAIDDLAGSSCQEALAFGVNQDVFARLARTVHKRTIDELKRLNPSL